MKFSVQKKKIKIIRFKRIFLGKGNFQKICKKSDLKRKSIGRQEFFFFEN